MVKRVSLLGIGAALCVVSCGCATTADGIAAGYGTLGKSWCFRSAENRLVALIESGEADRMVADGKTRKRVYERGVGDGKVLVTEHLIQGMVYRVEVRNRVDPAMDVLTTNVRQVNYGPADRSLQTVDPYERADVLRTIRYNSYDGQGQVAYRAYVKSDGTFQPVRTMPGDMPEWSDRNGIDLILRTDPWAGAVMQYRGCRPDGADRNGRLLEPDGRWIVLLEGPGISPVKYFVNRDIHPLMKMIAAGQLYDTNVLNAPPR